MSDPHHVYIIAKNRHNRNKQKNNDGTEIKKKEVWVNVTICGSGNLDNLICERK